jgi:hypothetical protein
MHDSAKGRRQGSERLSHLDLDWQGPVWRHWLLGSAAIIA